MGTGFKSLLVWQRAKDLSVEVYRVTGSGAFAQDFGLRDQLRRAAVSVPSNIAEGDERETDKESVRYLYIAKGSSAEVQTQLIIAGEIGYLPPAEVQRLLTLAEEISRMLSALIKARSVSFRP
jgi:four helix bundle protein